MAGAALEFLGSCAIWTKNWMWPPTIRKKQETLARSDELMVQSELPPGMQRGPTGTECPGFRCFPLGQRVIDGMIGRELNEVS